MRKGTETRERLLDIAESAVLAKGFGATSIEEIIAEAGITKSGFFYHFRDKNELARAMLVRYTEVNDRLFDDIFARGRELSDDPLQAFLVSLKLLAEMMADLSGGHPGCVIAAVCYQERLFDRELVALAAQSADAWNQRFRVALESIAEVYPPNESVDLADLGETLSCIIDGGITLSKLTGDPQRLSAQIMAYRSFVKLVFQPATSAVRSGPVLLAAE